MISVEGEEFVAIKPLGDSRGSLARFSKGACQAFKRRMLLFTRSWRPHSGGLTGGRDGDTALLSQPSSRKCRLSLRSRRLARPASSRVQNGRASLELREFVASLQNFVLRLCHRRPEQFIDDKDSEELGCFDVINFMNIQANSTKSIDEAQSYDSP
jgi:hypothetical protein